MASFWTINGKLLFDLNGKAIYDELCCCNQLELLENVIVFTNILHNDEYFINKDTAVNTCAGEGSEKILNLQTRSEYVDNHIQTKVIYHSTHIRTGAVLGKKILNFEYETLLPINNCNIPILNLESLSYRLEVDQKYTYLISSNLSNTNIPFPINQDTTTITIPSTELSGDNLFIYSYYNNNLGLIEDGQNYVPTMTVCKYVYQNSNDFIDDGLENYHRLVSGTIWDRKECYVDRIITGAHTHHGIHNLSQNESYGYNDCGPVYDNGDNTSSIYLTFIELESFPTKKLSNLYIFKYTDNYLIHCSGSTTKLISTLVLHPRALNANPNYTSYIEVPPYTSTYINNSVKKLTLDDYGYISAFMAGKCGTKVLTSNIELTSNFYSFYLSVGNQSSLPPHTSGIINGTVTQLTTTDEEYIQWKKIGTSSNSAYFCGNIQLSGGMFIFYPYDLDDSSLTYSWYWDGIPDLLPYNTSATINGSKTKLASNNECSVITDVLKYNWVLTGNTKYLMIDGQVLSTTVETGRILKLQLMPSCYWNSKIDTLFEGMAYQLDINSPKITITNNTIAVDDLNLTTNSIIWPSNNGYLIKNSKNIYGELYIKPKIAVITGLNNMSYIRYAEIVNKTYPLIVKTRRPTYNEAWVEHTCTTGWFAGINNTTISALYYDTNNNVWILPSGSHNIEIHGGTNTIPPAYYYNKKLKKFHNIFSSYYYYAPLGYNNLSGNFYLRFLWYDSLYGNELHPYEFKNTGNPYDNYAYRKYLTDKLYKTKHKDLQKLESHKISLMMDDENIDSKSKLTSYYNYNFKIDDYTIENVIDVDDYFFNNYILRDLNNKQTIHKFCIKPSEQDPNITYTGICCLILTALFIPSGKSSNYDDEYSDTGHRLWSVTTGNLKLDQYYSIGVCLFNLSAYNDNQYLTSFLGYSNLNTLTDTQLKNKLSSTIYDVIQLKSLTIVKPIKLLTGVIDDTYDKFIVPTYVINNMHSSQRFN